MIIVSVAAWVVPPTAVDADTEAVVVPTGVPGFPPPNFPPPHEVSPVAAASTMSKHKTCKAIRPRFRRAQKPKSMARRGKSSAKIGGFEEGIGGCISALAAVVATVSVVDTAAPLGVTEAGEKVQVASAGKLLHVKLTLELNPFSGVTVNVAVPLCPATMVSVGGFTDTWKSGAGRLMVYAAEATALLENPVAAAIASIVSVELTEIAPVYTVEDVVGVAPFIV